MENRIFCPETNILRECRELCGKFDKKSGQCAMLSQAQSTNDLVLAMNRIADILDSQAERAAEPATNIKLSPSANRAILQAFVGSLVGGPDVDVVGLEKPKERDCHNCRRTRGKFVFCEMCFAKDDRPYFEAKKG